MVISRRNRSQFPTDDSSYASRQSRPWDNHIAQLKPATPVPQVSVSDRLQLFEHKPPPPPSRDSNPLNAFLAPNLPASPTASTASSRPQLSSQSSESPPPSPPPTLKTRIGNRDVKPLITSPNPPPLVGLPIPSPINRPRSTSSKPIPESDSKAAKIASQIPLPPPPPLPDMTDDDHQPDNFSRRYSVRQSVRHSVRHSVRLPSVPGPMPKLMDDSQNPHSLSVRPPVPPTNPMDLLPDSSSFLDYNSDSRIMQLEGTDHAESSARDHTSFDDHDDVNEVPDSFDTFASLPNQEDLNTAPMQEVPPSPAPSSEKPMLPSISFKNSSLVTNHAAAPPPKSRPPPSVIDDDDGGLDVPLRISATPGAGRALRDLQRASITAATELANSIRLMSQQPNHGSMEEELSQRTHSTPSHSTREGGNAPQSRMQGQLMLRSRLFRRWNLRYATIINQAYFGPVLLLFRPDSKPMFQSFKLKSSKMIALTQATVTVQDTPRKHHSGLVHLFDLTTSQRTYTFACTDLKTRSLWVDSLSSPPPPS